MAQALLLPNWIAGLAGVVSWSVLYFLRIADEEAMMLPPEPLTEGKRQMLQYQFVQKLHVYKSL